MPCSDGGPRCSTESRDAIEREYKVKLDAALDKADKLTDMLCEMCTEIERVNLQNSLIRANREVARWWEDHKEADALRLEQEKNDEKVAHHSVVTALKYIETYQNTMSAGHLPEEDNQYFANKIDLLTSEIEGHVKRFPSILADMLGGAKK